MLLFSSMAPALTFPHPLSQDVVTRAFQGFLTLLSHPTHSYHLPLTSEYSHHVSCLPFLTAALEKLPQIWWRKGTQIYYPVIL